jgi:hypothetical protein
MARDEAREVFPLQFFDPGKHSIAPGKDFSIRPHAADMVVPELEPELAAELEAAAGTATDEEPEGIEEPGESPKGSSATASANFSDVTPTPDAATVEEPAAVEKALSPPSTEPSVPTSSPPTSLGSSVPPAVPALATTPSSGSAKLPKPATKRS